MITFRRLENDIDKETFITKNQESFQEGYERYFGKCESLVIPREDIEKSLEKGEAFLVYLDTTVVGGVIVYVDHEKNTNDLEILFVDSKYQDKGIGYQIWEDIKKRYNVYKKWNTCCVKFDKRNVHFYTSKCGFKIIKEIKIDDPSFIGDHNDGMYELEAEVE